MAGRLTVVGLGPAGPELITPQVTERLAATPTVRLRTARHPAAAVVEAPSYDHVYEAADRFADVYEEIARDLLALAAVDDIAAAAIALLRAHAEQAAAAAAAGTPVFQP